ncbi:FeoA family protein [Clostridium paraputrificum]|uniref:FeoA family protein n=1 Tax=Clostridium paraputrificum TaxID=29363 RepID=UPI00189A7429|nr:ferrous iron transport protein A [Clostridium paraputrificum]MDB2124463.1 ferrous iron transport protein A [Clostridium paraputrificum]
MCLCELELGEIGTINEIKGDSKLTKRLWALGCIEGTKIQLKMVAPLGDPIIVNLRGFDLAIRKKDAKNIFIQK